MTRPKMAVALMNSSTLTRILPSIAWARMPSIPELFATSLSNKVLADTFGMVGGGLLSVDVPKLANAGILGVVTGSMI